MLNKIVEWWQFIKTISKRDSSNVLFAPDYDPVTSRMASWASSWRIPGVSLYRGNEANHSQALTLLKQKHRSTLLFMFLGHGRTAGLLTKPGIGKADSPVGCKTHHCLLDTDDLTTGAKDVHIVAWACSVGRYFGPKVATLKSSGFLGFSGEVGFVINDIRSEQLWSSVMKELFQHVAQRGYIESHDAEWLRLKLLELRRKLKRGEVNTGIFNQANTTFLKLAARKAYVEVSRTK